jgi:predicted dehydrogenase
MQPLGIGIIGCGTISGAYLTALRGFPELATRAVADLDEARAETRAAEFGTRAVSVAALLADPSIDLIVNLTVPKAHAEVGMRVLAAGKHLYAEKPLALTFEEGRRLVAEAEERGLSIGSAPDTFLGGAHQTCRALVDEGSIGRPVGGTAYFMCPGHERWHPNPAFYYEEGGGPMLDMGPYYITQLVNLLGPVAEVAGFASRLRKARTVLSDPLRGSGMPVEVDTHVMGLLAFESGAVVQIGMSFDVEDHRHSPLEIYGTDGVLLNPDPNLFGGRVEWRTAGGDWTDVPVTRPWADGNFRSLGVADLARSIAAGEPHRASGTLALHVLEVMLALHRASDERRVLRLSTSTERPAPLSA